MYGEDMEWSLRFRRGGWAVVFNRTISEPVTPARLSIPAACVVDRSTMPSVTRPNTAYFASSSGLFARTM